MKKRMTLMLLLAILMACCAFSSLADERLPGVWSAVRMATANGELTLSGSEALNAGLFFSISSDGSYETLAYANGQFLTSDGQYAFRDDQRLVLEQNGEKALCDVQFDGDMLVLTELGAVETAAYFERCDSTNVCGYWRSVRMDAGNGEIDIDGNQNIGMSLYFRADGSCTGVITSNGKSSARDMTYLASSDAIALIESNAISLFTYSLDGDTMVCVFTSADGSTSIAYTLIR